MDPSFDPAAALRQLRRLRSPARRAAAATLLLDQISQLEREVSGIRDDAVRRLREQGESYGGIATSSGLTRTRVVQLLTRSSSRSTQTEPALAEPSQDPAAS